MPLQGADRPPLGIRPPHTAHSDHSHVQRVDSVASLHAVGTEAPITNVLEHQILAILVIAKAISRPVRDKYGLAMPDLRFFD